MTPDDNVKIAEHLDGTKMDFNDYSPAMENMSDGLNNTVRSAYFYYNNSHPGTLLLLGIHRAVHEGNVHTVKLMVESGVPVDAEDNIYGFTPLHVAVIINNLEMVEYLLSLDGVIVNSKYCNNVSPLHLAAQMGHTASVRKLIEAGSHVNTSDFRGDTPLHKSVNHPEIARLLIRYGAHIDAANHDGETPLHHAVRAPCPETVCLLLYYNADSNVLDDRHELTPFMHAIQAGDIHIARVLFEYADESNESDALELALRTNSPFVIEMVNRNSSSTPCRIEWPMRSVFQTVLERQCFSKMKNAFDLFSLFESQTLTEEEMEGYVQVMIDGGNVELVVESFAANENYHLFFEKCVGNGLKLEQLTALTCRLLEYGYRATNWDIIAIFSNYGFCELIRILWYMDNDYTKGWPFGEPVLCRLMFDLDYRVEEDKLFVNRFSKSLGDVALLEYFTYPGLIEKFVDISGNQNERGDVALLTELARDAARRHIWGSLRVKSTCRFYTAIDNLKIPSAHKKILTFERKLYSVQVEEDLLWPVCSKRLILQR